VRTPLGAAVALAFIAGLVSPVSAVASPTIVAQAAVTQSTITGHVTDSRGNPLSGAAVRIEGAGKTYSLTSGGDGSFAQTVSPGVYTVTVNRGGYQTGQNDVAVTPGAKFDVAISLQESNLSSLRVIGRSSVSSSRAPFNVSESAVSVLPPLEITLRQNNNLTDTVGILPGVVASRSFTATPNTSFVVRGGALQTRVTIDGHPVSSGISGQWNSNYAAAGIFQDVEVVKGAGLNGAIAGESAVGTVNLRTRDFTRNNTAGAQLGTDSYAGGIYNVFADVNFLKNNRASLIVAKSFVGYNGPWDNQFKNRSNAISTFPVGQGVVPNIVGIDQWQGDFSNRYSLQAELAKLRYRFSESSSLTLEYLGLQGQYQPQGGSYAAYVGQMTLQACQNGSGATATFSPTMSGCTATSQYTAPYTLNNVGNTVDAYTWFPNSFIQNNEPQFAAEFRTAIKNDTLLFRPYTHLINRYISGASENLYPGNGGGWFAVTSAANCQVTFVAATAAGAKGPCFPSYMSPNAPAYVGNDTTSHGFATTGTAPTCSPVPPYTCFTTRTGVQNDGTTNYGTPFSQPELDRLNGYTFNYIHPVGDNVYNFSYDYRKDFSQSQSGDQTAAAAGCTYVIGSASTKVSNAGTGLGPVGTSYQPTCSLPGFLPRSAINVPPTVTQYGDFALTGTFALGEKLKLAFGNYFETYKLNAQIEDPTLRALYKAAGSEGATPVALVSRTTNYSHYDPHLALEYRASRSTSLRASAGSSITQPYPAIVSGFGSITIPNAANGGNYTDSIPNFNLKPETTVAYDLGADQRLHDGGVLSLDLYDLTIHDVFLSNTKDIGMIPLVCGPGNGGSNPNALCLQSDQINGPIQRGYGVELALTKIPVNGWGYYLSSTLSRTYLDQLPLSLYLSNVTAAGGNFNVSGAQLFGNPFFKSYGQMLFADAQGSLFELGAEYNGPNNYSFGAPYTIWDASVRIPIQKRLRVQISAQNLFNLNDGSGLGRSLSGQGNIQPTLYLKNGVLLPSGASSNLNGLTPRSIRFLLDFTP
jgi:outer membrane receptor protein involved in Fe transport